MASAMLALVLLASALIVPMRSDSALIATAWSGSATTVTVYQPWTGLTTSKTASLGKTRAVLRNRAMWLWNWSSNDAVLRFARRNHVTEIFTYAHPGFSENRQLNVRLADLTRRGTKFGIQMWAMGGDPSWVTEQEVALRWVAEVRNSGYFRNLHLEIEPHSQAGYWSNKANRNRAYIQLLRRINRAAHPHSIELSLPWWYHTISFGNTTLDKAAVSAVDRVTIVTFNNEADGIRTNAKRAVATARAQRKPFRFASETNDVEADWITFHAHRNAHMLSVQNNVSRAFVRDPLFRGFAVHDYQGWSNLR